MPVLVGNTTTNTVITVTSISRNGVIGQIIPTGTTMTFQQTAAPTGYTKVTTYNDYAMRIVSGSVANRTNGVAFTTAFASQSVSGTVGDTTLTTTQIPAHNHGVSDPGHSHQWPSVVGTSGGQYGFTDNSNAGSSGRPFIWSSTTGISIGNTGGGGAHNHAFTGTAINMSVNYVDFILATAN